MLCDKRLLPRELDSLYISERMVFPDASDQWITVSGTFVISHKYTEAVQPGELLYISNKLLSYKTLHNNTYANYSVTLWLTLVPGSVIELRCRRSNDGKCIAASIQPKNNKVVLKVYGPNENIIQSVNYNFPEIAYNFSNAISLKFSDELVFVTLDNYPVICQQIDLNSSEYGVSIYVPEIPKDIMKLKRLYIRPTIKWPLPQLEHSTDLIDAFRRQTLNEIDYPAILNYEEFKKAYKKINSIMHYGRSETAWQKLGYPLRIIDTNTYLNPLIT